MPFESFPLSNTVHFNFDSSASSTSTPAAAAAASGTAGSGEDAEGYTAKLLRFLTPSLLLPAQSQSVTLAQPSTGAPSTATTAQPGAVDEYYSVHANASATHNPHSISVRPTVRRGKTTTSSIRATGAAAGGTVGVGGASNILLSRTTPTTAITPSVKITAAHHSHFQPSDQLDHHRGVGGGCDSPLLASAGAGEDARSIASSIRPGIALTQILKRFRGESGLIKQSLWMPDEGSTECSDCQTAFTTWRRRHHCRVCSRIFCATCAPNLVDGSRFKMQGRIRACNVCYELMQFVDRSQASDPSYYSSQTQHGAPTSSSLSLNSNPHPAQLAISLPLEASIAKPPQAQYSASHLFPRSSSRAETLTGGLHGGSRQVASTTAVTTPEGRRRGNEAAGDKAIAPLGAKDNQDERDEEHERRFLSSHHPSPSSSPSSSSSSFSNSYASSTSSSRAVTPQPGHSQSIDSPLPKHHRHRRKKNSNNGNGRKEPLESFAKSIEDATTISTIASERSSALGKAAPFRKTMLMMDMDDEEEQQQHQRHQSSPSASASCPPLPSSPPRPSSPFTATTRVVDPGHLNPDTALGSETDRRRNTAQHDHSMALLPPVPFLPFSTAVAPTASSLAATYDRPTAPPATPAIEHASFSAEQNNLPNSALTPSSIAETAKAYQLDHYTTILSSAPADQHLHPASTSVVEPLDISALLDQTHHGPGVNPLHLHRILADSTSPVTTIAATTATASSVPFDYSHSMQGGSIMRGRNGEGSAEASGALGLVAVREDLSEATMLHLRRMIRQSFHREGIDTSSVIVGLYPETSPGSSRRINRSAWEEKFVEMMVRLAKDLAPDVRSRRDSIDVKRYLRIKKIPGGRPVESEYVDGVVFTHSLMHTAMPRVIQRPRIMLLAFDMEFVRTSKTPQFVSLDPIIKQEKEYLRNLVSRIAAHRPHLLLVERNVPRLALEYLWDAKIAVARNVKRSILDSLARQTEADLIISMDQLALESATRLGTCAIFRVETFAHSLIPGGKRKKSILRFEGCRKELGSSLILRGGSLEELRKVKKVAVAMSGIFYDAKLLGSLLRDELVLPLEEIMLPLSTSTSATSQYADDIPANSSQSDSVPTTIILSMVEAELAKPPSAQDRARLSTSIEAALHPYLHHALSSSPYIKIPPPHVLVRMMEEDRRLSAMRALKEYEEMEAILRDEEGAAASQRSKEASEIDEMEAGALFPLAKKSKESSTESSFPEESLEDLTLDGLNLESNDLSASTSTLLPSTASSASSSSPSVTAASFEEPTTTIDPVFEALSALQTPEELARLTSFEDAEERYSQQLVLWKSYLSPTSIPDSFDPAEHQKLHVLCSLVCTQTSRICIPPTVRSIDFYGSEDISLGQYIERISLEAGRTCEMRGCDRLMLVHYETFVHGNTRVMIIPEVHQIDLQRSELEGQIVMWSFCIECKTASAQEAMSDDSYRLSFAKYLELSFYPQHLLRKDRACEHDAHQSHVRFIMSNRITFQISVDSIDLRDAALPPSVIKVHSVKQLELRNEEYITVLTRTNAFFDSVTLRVESFNYDLVPSDQLEESRSIMHGWRRKAELDRRTIIRLLRSDYEQVQGTEMSSVRISLQRLAVEWDLGFAAFEKNIFPSDKDVRRMTALQLKRLFTDSTTTSPSPSRPLSPEPRGLTSSTLTTATVLPASIELDESEMQPPPPSMPAPIPQDSLPPGGHATTSHLSLPSSATTSHTASPTTGRIVLSTAISDDHDESDSTVYGDTTAFRRSSIYAITSEAESEIELMLARPPGRGVANLVNFFSEDSFASGVRPSPGRSSRIIKNARRSEVLSDGGVSGYAANVGVLHLANRTTASDVSKIPHRVSRHTFGSSIVSSPTTSQSGRKSPSAATRQLTSSGSADVGKSRSNLGDRSSGGVGKRAMVTTSAGTKDYRGGITAESVSDRHLRWSRPKLSSRSTTPDISRSVLHSIGRSSIPRRPALSHRTSSASHVSTIAQHFNDKARESDRQSRLALSRRTRARPVAEATPRIQVFENVRDAVKEDSDSEAGTSSDDEGADDEQDYGEEVERDVEQTGLASKKEGQSTATSSYKQPSLFDQHLLLSPLQPLSDHRETSHSSHAPSDSEAGFHFDAGSLTDSSSIAPSARRDSSLVSRIASEGDSSGNERGSIIKTLANLWSYKRAEFPPLLFPLDAKEHLFSSNPILVREDEPSSIVSFALSSQAYRDKLDGSDTDRSPRVIERSEVFMPDLNSCDDVRRSASMWGVVDLEDERADVAATLRKPFAKHFKLQFEESTTVFFCKIFFAEQFDALRRQSGCDEQFIESMARSCEWKTTGGKSKVEFLKTKDDRFIIKEIIPREMDAFLSFAPAYFDYFAQAKANESPTALAKILGFYRIGLKNPATGKSMRTDILVIENLFYGRQLSQIYDLKGSNRNRRAAVSGDRPGEVLLDENLVDISIKSPLFLREASKRIMLEAIRNDTLFLSNLNVMDYSLVVGIDSQKQELVVGIVDYIRTFTWEKKLENLVKDSALLGGGASLIMGKANTGPTIVTPVQYKNRFREAMDRYFLIAPDFWMPCAPSSSTSHPHAHSVNDP